MNKHPARWLAGLLLALSGAVSAQVPGLSLAFRDRVGVVGPSDSIEVWLTVSLDATADAVSIDGSSPGTEFGLPPGILPEKSYDGVPFAEYTAAGTSAAYQCSGTFWPCAPAPYTFDFEYGPLSFLGKTAWSIAPGDSQEYLFGHFTPDGGPVAAGTYRFYTAYLTLYVDGFDASGNPIVGYANLAWTCTNGDDACAFTRTVLVPEPQTYVLMGLGLLAVGWAARRRALSRA